MALEHCTLIDLPKISDTRGNLTFIEGNRHIPFDIKRIYYLYDIPANSIRGGHAHKGLSQLLIAISGRFDVILDDGANRKTVHLNKPYQGLLIRPMIWRELENFSAGAVCMVAASEIYIEDDYYRDYTAFIAAAREVK